MAAGSNEAKLELFLQWLKVNGAELRGCQIKYCGSSKGFGFFSSNDSHDGIHTVIPLDLAITPMRVLEDSLVGPECRLMFDEGDVDDRLLIMLFLTVHRLRKNSSWKPYLDMLPTEFGNPLWFNADELSELMGTSLHRATELQKKNLKSLFDDKVKKLVEKLLALDGTCESNEVRFEDFLWANSIFWTRALTIPFPRSYVIPQPQQTEDSSTEEESIWIEGLVPGIDFCNHALKALATWEVDATGSTTGIPNSMCLLSVGDIFFDVEKEICINYGDKGNEELLYLYGFVLEDNPDDYLMIHYPTEGIADMPPFSEAKMQLLESQNAQLRCLLPKNLLESGKHEFVFPEEFISGLRTVAMTESEVEQVSSILEEIVGASESQVQSSVQQVCGDCIALQLLVHLLNNKMAELVEGTGTEESDGELLLKGERREKKWASIVYRQGQKQLARHFLWEAERALKFARASALVPVGN